MKLIINKNQIDTTPEMFLRKAGYGYIRDRKTGHDSFVRRLGSGFYPRLHMYAEERGEQVIFNLHLDQKQASYAGAHAHNAEYGGEVVEEEIERLSGLIAPTLSPSPAPGVPATSLGTGAGEGSSDVLDKIGHRELPCDMEKPKKLSWWGKLFS